MNGIALPGEAVFGVYPVDVKVCPGNSRCKRI